MRVMHEALLGFVLLYGSKKLMWIEKKSRIGSVQIDNLKRSVEY